MMHSGLADALFAPNASGPDSIAVTDRRFRISVSIALGYGSLSIGQSRSRSR
jgi:hypothetical protein